MGDRRRGGVTDAGEGSMYGGLSGPSIWALVMILNGTEGEAGVTDAESGDLGRVCCERGRVDKVSFTKVCGRSLHCILCTIV